MLDEDNKQGDMEKINQYIEEYNIREYFSVRIFPHSKMLSSPVCQGIMSTKCFILYSDTSIMITWGIGLGPWMKENLLLPKKALSQGLRMGPLFLAIKLRKVAVGVK